MITESPFSIVYPLPGPHFRRTPAPIWEWMSAFKGALIWMHLGKSISSAFK